ncbi:MAG: hypothetical protein ACQEW5_19795 [Bacillota bacterium]
MRKKPDDYQVVFQKYQASNTCAITGEVTNKNKVYPGDFHFKYKRIRNNFSRIKNYYSSGY